MLFRRALVAIVTLAGMLVSSGVADAAELPLNWQDAVALAPFAIYRPHRTLGLTEKVGVTECGDNGKPSVEVTYGPPHSRRRPNISVSEHSPVLCGNPGESHLIRTLRINGRRAYLTVGCAHPYPCLHDTDGYRNGYGLTFFEPGHPRTAMYILSVRVRERALLRFARSMRRVRPAAATLHLNRFESPDGRYYCYVVIGTAGCFDGFSRYAQVLADGEVQGCACRPGRPGVGPRLRADQRVREDAFACAPAAGGMTCTVAADGAAHGMGFTIDATTITPLGGATLSPLPLGQQ